MTDVHIELRRLQTWLFEVPRLRAMVGANALLGELMRVDLPYLAADGKGAWATAQVDGSQFPASDGLDPLKAHDDPREDARVRGILSKDGGHFEVRLAKGHKEFAAAAAALIRKRTPGVQFGISFRSEHSEEKQFEERADEAFLSTDLPVFRPCEWTGRGLASTSILQGSEKSGNRPQVSLEVQQRHDKAKEAQEGCAKDLASLLTRCSALKDLEAPSDFSQIAAGGYLAVVHADGNGVGAQAKDKDHASRSAVFHRNRVWLRRATLAAINHVCELDGKRREELHAEGKHAYAPLQLLMLGGDDLLVVCRADMALRFAEILSLKLSEVQNNSATLSLGIGVVISRPAVPFHTLHAAAEALAASAKRLARGRADAKQPNVSVIDWAVHTATWSDDPIEMRRREWIRGSGDNLRILSNRPMPVSGAGLATLQGLLKVGELAGPRSQRRYLLEQLGMGKHVAEQAFEELSAEAKAGLRSAGVADVWNGTTNSNAPWTTHLLDLIEVDEIRRLGKTVKRTPSMERQRKAQVEASAAPTREVTA